MIERWQGAFATANHAGAACAIAVVGATAVLALRPAGTRMRFPDGLLLWIVVIASAVGLIASQSRFATLGVLAAWLIAGRPGGRPAKIAGGMAMLLAGSWLVLTRGASVVPGAHDVSTIHHLRLWADACMIAFSNPVSGCGWGHFGQVWQGWMKPLSWQFGFTSALSSPLTLLAECGIPLGLPVLAVAVIPLVTPARTPRLRSARAAWMTACVAGASCTLQRDPLVILLLLAIACWWAWSWWRQRHETTAGQLRRSLCMATGTVGVFALAVVFVGQACSDYKIVVEPRQDVSVELIPRKALGTVLVVRGFGSGPLGGTSVLAGLVMAGWTVVVMDQIPDAENVRTAVARATSDGAVRVIASGAGAQVVPSGLAVPVFFVDPWRGATDTASGTSAASPEMAITFHLADYGDWQGLGTALIKTLAPSSPSVPSGKRGGY